MKKNLTKALFGFVIFMALFASTAVSHKNHASMHGGKSSNETCILASSQIAACPDGNTLQLIAFHINGIRSLAQAIFFTFVFICIAGAIQIFSRKFFRAEAETEGELLKSRFRKNWWKMETDGEIFEESIKNWISIRKKAAA